MKFFSFQRIPLIIVCMLVVLFILFFLMFSLGIVSFRSVTTLGNYSNYVYEKNIKQAISDIVLENTKELSKGYSTIFAGAESYTKILAKLTTHYLENPDYYNKPDKYSAAVLGLFKKDSYFISSTKDNISICYWGTENTIPENVASGIKAISYLSKLIFAVDTTYPYADEIWVNNLRDEYLISSPHFAKAITHDQFLRYRTKFKNDYIKYRDYYKKHPEKKAELIWTGPRLQVYKERKDLSVKCPIFENGNEFIGFAELDIDVDDVVKAVLHQRLLRYNSNADILGDSFLLTDDGILTAVSEKLYRLLKLPEHPELIHENLFFDYKYTTKLSDSKSRNVSLLTNKLTFLPRGVTTLELDNNLFFIAYSRIQANNWIVASILPMKKMLYPIELTNEKMEYVINGLLRNYFFISIVFLVIALILSLILFWHLVNTPVKRLRNIVKKIGQGDFCIKADVHGSREISDLSEGINQMGQDLIKFTENLEKETKKNEAIATELKIATEIQKSVIPKITEDFLNEKFDIYAKLIPAKEMSGDFYDLFYLNNNTLVLVLADVAGKGIGAAFFMSMAKIIIKNFCMETELTDTGKILNKINQIICRENKNYMFLTMYLIFYDIGTGKITFSNAGHHKMVTVKKDGSLSAFGIFENAPLGLFEEQVYKTGTYQLDKGEFLAVYTDGLNEAPDQDNAEYGNRKIMDSLNVLKDKDLKDIGDSIIADVLKHESGNKFDDITLLILKRNV